MRCEVTGQQRRKDDVALWLAILPLIIADMLSKQTINCSRRSYTDQVKQSLIKASCTLGVDGTAQGRRGMTRTFRALRQHPCEVKRISHTPHT